MQTKPKTNSVITHAVNEDRSEITFKVRDAGETTLKLALVNSLNLERATLHGLIQRVSDAAAIARDTATGKSASAADKLVAMSELVEHYNSGSAEWRLARAAGDGIGRSYLLNALCELYTKKTQEELREWLKARSQDERKALENDPRIKPKIDAQRARGTEKIDTQSILSGLDE